MKKQKSKQIEKENHNEYNKKNDYILIDPDFPNAPKLEIYHETFGGLKNITEQWYKENRA